MNLTTLQRNTNLLMINTIISSTIAILHQIAENGCPHHKMKKNPSTTTQQNFLQMIFRPNGYLEITIAFAIHQQQSSAKNLTIK